MLSKAQKAALQEIEVVEKELMADINRQTRKLFPKRRENMMEQVVMRLERIRAYYIQYQLEQVRFRKTVEDVYDKLMQRNRFSEAAELAKKYNL